MALFQPSTKAVSAACQEIADTVGASGDTEMTARAGRSLFAALQHFNNRANWDFMLTEANVVRVFAPFTVTGVSASAGQASAAAPAGHGISVDDFIVASGFAVGVRVSATAASGFGIYGTVTGFSAGVTVVSGEFTRDMYDLPSDWKREYSIRLLSSQRTLRSTGRRFYDRSITSEQTTSTTTNYDLFAVGARGKIRMLPPPATSDVLLMRYYRRMSIPATTATADVVDIPQDYEPYLMSWAKWHFLTDKGEGRGEQMRTWFALSQEGLATMIKDQTRKPDEDLAFIPGQFAYQVWGDANTRVLPWDYA
jgi:hypothetical protein